MVNKIKAMVHTVGIIMIPMIIFNGLFYTIGAFIAWDTNPLNWWLITSVTGRCLYVIYNVGVVANIPTFWNEVGD
jgi:hypothetical protein